MNEAVGDLWTFEADYRCITTNGIVQRNGQLVMGAGNALEAKRRYPGLPLTLGEHVKRWGNHVYCFPEYALFSFPTKNNWKDNSDLRLIARSAVELVYLVDVNEFKSIVLPRPGCGHGKLSWKNQVKPVLSRLLDDRFVVVSQDH